ncbi:MAG: cation:proton antiporter [Candidatus Micrarchaeota archaeon]|nr:cation:proton antiporter [Candidatus Micrarchaeota archaeon]
MDSSVGYLLQLSFFIIFALLGTVIALKFRQPYVVGLLVFGMLAGPGVLGLVQNQDLIGAISQLGAIFLLFTVGIEFSISRLMKSGFRALIITTVKMLVLFLVGYEIALYFGLDMVTSFYIGAMIAITSTAILFKIVSEKKMAGHPVLPLLFSMLIVEDIFAVAALTFFSSLSGGAATNEDRLVSLAISLGLLGVFYVIVRKPASNLILRLTSTLNEDLMILVSFSLCLVMSMVAGYFGLSPAIGAFLAGSIISSLPNSRKIEKTLKPLLLMFAALFFLSLGMRIDPQSVMDHWNVALALVIAFVVVCFGSVYALLYFTGTASKNALFGASSMVVLGEFSLIIASEATGDMGNFLVAVGSMGVVVTAMISSFLLDRQEKIRTAGEARIPYNMRFAAGSLAIYFSGLVRDFSPGGSFWNVTSVCWGCVRQKIGRMAFVGLLMVAARFAVRFMDLPVAQSAQLRAAILMVGAVPILYYAIGILRDTAPVLDSLSRTIARHKKNAKAENRILLDFGAVVFLIFLASALPEIVEYLQLPPFFGFGDELCLLFAFAFLWDLARNAGKLREIGKKHIAKRRAKIRKARREQKMRARRREGARSSGR